MKLISGFFILNENVWDKHSESVLPGFEQGPDRVERRGPAEDAAKEPQGQT